MHKHDRPTQAYVAIHPIYFRVRRRRRVKSLAPCFSIADCDACSVHVMRLTNSDSDRVKDIFVLYYQYSKLILSSSKNRGLNKKLS